MRVKTYHLKDDEGRGIRIGAITRKQVQGYIENQSKDTDEYGFPVRSMDLLIQSLNNAQMETETTNAVQASETAGEWTAARIYEKWDLPAIKELIEEIMRYSGLVLLPEREGKAPAGESKPAAV